MKQSNTETLEARITHTEDILEIQLLQNTYQQWLTFRRTDKIMELFAQHETTSVGTTHTGPYEGRKGVKEFFEDQELMNKLPGLLIEHYAICPVIHVAKDGKTAKGIFFSPGINVSGFNNTQIWDWGKYGCDYIKENGKWKIWHLCFFRAFGASWEKGPLYVEGSGRYFGNLGSEKMIKALGKAIGPGKPDAKPFSGPFKDHKMFDPKGMNNPLPEPAEPYDTWKE